MKPYIYISMLILCAVLIVVGTIQYSINKNKESEASAKASETKKINWIIENAISSITIKEDNEVYEAYLIGDETEKYTLKEDNFLGDKDDTIVEGAFSLYLTAESEDDTKEYKQVIKLRNPLIFNTKNKNISTYTVNKHSIIAIYQTKSKDNTVASLYAVDDGELTSLTTTEIPVLKRKIKSIQQNYLQTAEKKQDNVYEVTSWTLDSGRLQLKEADKTSIDNEKAIERWVEEEDYYLPFKNLTISKDILTIAEQGMLMGSQYPIGTSISEITKSNDEYIKTEQNDGLMMVEYPEVTYYYDGKTKQVNSIAIPGMRLKVDMSAVNKALGKPEAIAANKENNGYIATYSANHYEMKFILDSNQHVQSIQLVKKQDSK